jgi:hypothetical protein
MPRRSSLKKGPSSFPREFGGRRRRRRASIGVCEDISESASRPGDDDDDSRPPDHNNDGQKVQQRRRRSISFEDHVTVRQVAPASALAGSADAIWINEAEYEAIRNGIVRIVEAAHGAVDGGGNGGGGGTADDDGSPACTIGRDCTVTTADGLLNDCSRGLERLFAPEIAQLKRVQAVECVLQEQYLQREMGDYDEDVLAKIYKYSTMRSRVEASRRAGEDAREAEEYLEPQRRMMMHRRASM